MWQGECVHDAIADCLAQTQQGRDPQYEPLIATLRQRMIRDWQFSENRRFREEPTSIGRFGTALFEHEYDEVPPDTQISETIDGATAMFSNFYKWSKAHPSFLGAFKSAKRRWIEPPPWGAGAPGFMVGNVRARTKVDLALHLHDGRFLIYDWKTGSAPKKETNGVGNETQVSVYMLWPRLTFNVPLERVSSSLVYLGGAGAREITFQLDEEVAVETKQIIEDSVEQAQRWESYVRKGRLSLKQLDFAGSVNECRKCNYKRACRAALTRKDLP